MYFPFKRFFLKESENETGSCAKTTDKRKIKNSTIHNWNIPQRVERKAVGCFTKAKIV